MMDMRTTVCLPLSNKTAVQIVGDLSILYHSWNYMLKLPEIIAHNKLKSQFMEGNIQKWVDISDWVRKPESLRVEYSKNWKQKAEVWAYGQ